MTINTATEQCDCPIPMIIGWAETGWEGLGGGAARDEFADACPDGYALWSGPFTGDVEQNDDTVTVTRKSGGECLIAEYKKL